MSLTTSITAFVSDKDAEFRKHKKVLLTCLRANVTVPKETCDYFGETSPDECTLDNKLQTDLVEGKHFKLLERDHEEMGFEIFIDKLPKNVYKIRFENSW
jgi:hypothetical protein